MRSSSASSGAFAPQVATHVKLESLAVSAMPDFPLATRYNPAKHSLNLGSSSTAYSLDLPRAHLADIASDRLCDLAECSVNLVFEVAPMPLLLELAEVSARATVSSCSLTDSV